MKAVMSVLAIVALVAVVGFAVQPVSAANVNVDTAKVVVTGGPQGGVISIWRSTGGEPLANGTPTGLLESATPVSPAGYTEAFVPYDQVSNVFIWTAAHGYTFLQTVAPNSAAIPGSTADAAARGEVITLAAK